MKKLLILSGKGGTGKTTTASAFIEFSKTKVYADCDVDAPNLHLVMRNEIIPQLSSFYGSQKAKIVLDKCINCGLCEKNCRFNAVKKKEDNYYISEISCEGCGVCKLVCKNDAIVMEDDESGTLICYKDSQLFSTAELKMGRGNSGKLVNKVKTEILKTDIVTPLAIVDGSPGIGCPVVASIGAMDMGLIVVEPSVSGISDLERLVETVKAFQIEMAVCVNKFDISTEKTEEIRRFCECEKIPFVGVIPYDKKVFETVNTGKSIAQIDRSPAKTALMEIYSKILKIMKLEELENENCNTM